VSDRQPSRLHRARQWSAAHGRRAATTAADVAGIGLVAAGLWQYHPGAGLIGAGVGTLFVSFAASSQPKVRP
jgi:hypothetical protein